MVGRVNVDKDTGPFLTFFTTHTLVLVGNTYATILNETVILIGSKEGLRKTPQKVGSSPISRTVNNF